MTLQAVPEYRSPSPFADKSDTLASPRFCRTAQLLIVLISVVLHGVFLSKATPLQSANDRSRWCTVWSLVERGTFQIDEIRQRKGWDTIDLVHVDEHFYSTKPPLLTSLVAGITWSLQRLTGWNLLDDLQPLTFLVLVIVNLVPFTVSLLAWIAILDRIAARTETRLASLALAAFGTLLTPFLMTLNNHTMAAAATTFAIYALMRILSDEKGPLPNWLFLVCGFASSAAVTNELPAALFLVMGLVLAFRRSAHQTLAYFVPAAAIPLLALVAVNVIATGSWKPVYADYGTDKYRFVIDGIPSYWLQPQGIDRNLDSTWAYFLHCTIGHHGIFSLTPIAILALIGWMLRVRDRDRPLSPLLAVGAIVSVVVLAFYLTRTQNYNYGGVSCGLRWALWLTPFWLVAIVPALDRCWNSRVATGLVTGLAMVSMYSAWQPIENPWRQPWLFQWMESRGWIDYSNPPLKLEKPLWTWFASLPDAVEPESAWIEFDVAQPGSESRRVRLTLRPTQNSPTSKGVMLEVKENGGVTGPPERLRNIEILVEPFRRGEPPADFLTWSDPNVTPAQQQADLSFVRGLPRKVPYQARTVRYLRTPLRVEALKCQQATAHVTFRPSDDQPAMNHRCDVWLSDDVPFGVAQVEFHISDPATAAVLFHERWIVHDCWPKVRPFEKP